MSALFLSDSAEDFTHIREALLGGELVAVPTETVYGLAANALNTHAVGKIFRVKGRPLIDPLIVHVHTLEQVQQLAKLDAVALRLARHCWPGPLTLVLPKLPTVPDLVTATLPSVAIRMPAHPLFRKLLAYLKLPLAAPSANPFGYISPTRAEHVRDSLGEAVPLILDGGPCTHGVESTILDLSQPGIARILRPGPLQAEDLAKFAGITISPYSPSLSGKSDTAQVAPGMLDKHYSPHAAVHLTNNPDHLHHATEHTAAVWLKRPTTATTPHTFWLSEDGDLSCIAHNLFHLMRTLDQQGYNTILIERPPESGIGIALNDRLRRAACKS